MIRLVTLETYEDKALEKLQKTLYTAFGVGCEHSADLKMPAGHPVPLDAEALLKDVEGVRAYQDDKLLYLTPQKLKDRVLASGTVPTPGFCFYNQTRALISTYGVKDLEEDSGQKIIGRHAMHQLGHLWELHHCLDPRCSMYPPWTLAYNTGDSTFCNFCRDKSEQKIRLAKS